MNHGNASTASDEPRLPATERDRGFWLASLRGELVEPINGLLDLVVAVLEDSKKDPSVPDDFVLSLERILRSAQAMAETAKNIDDPTAALILGTDHVAPVHHELRSYMTAIIGYCELWAEDCDGSVLKSFEDDLRKIRQIALGIVQFIESVAKVSSEEVVVDLANSDLIPIDIGAIPPRLDGAGPIVGAVTGTLLVVDDKEVNREVLRRRLERDGHTVVLAADGRQALRMIRSQPFDLVLLDLVMPGLSGWQVLERLKADPSLCSVPVLMMSALAEIDSIVRCIELGAEDFLARPVAPTLLRARISACLEKKHLRDREQQYQRKIEEAERRANDLLLAVFPEPIVKKLKGVDRPAPCRHESVAVIFADLVNFANYCDVHEPEDVVGYLNEVVAAWEQTALTHKVQKIKTIGDAFLAAAGLFEEVENPVLSCVKCGLEMIGAVQQLPTGWDLRVGIDFGPVVSGVIGSRQYVYDLWGDTVNMAVEVESQAAPGSIMLTADAWQQIAGLARGWERLIPVKGKPKPIKALRFAGFMA